MSINVSILPGTEPTAHLNPGNGVPFAVIELEDHPARACYHVNTVAEADALIKAAVAAKDLLLAAQGPVLDSESWTCTSCGGQFIGHRPGGGQCKDCQPDPGLCNLPDLAGGKCQRDAGHSGDCGPGTQHVHTGYCPVCDVRTKADGSHTTPKGTKIPASTS